MPALIVGRFPLLMCTITGWLGRSAVLEAEISLAVLGKVVALVVSFGEGENSGD